MHKLFAKTRRYRPITNSAIRAVGEQSYNDAQPRRLPFIYAMTPDSHYEVAIEGVDPDGTVPRTKLPAAASGHDTFRICRVIFLLSCDEQNHLHNVPISAA